MPRSTKSPRFRELSWILLGTAAAVVLLALFGPSLIHVGYRIATSDGERQTQAALYQRLANSEAFDNLPESKRQELRAQRMRLFYWFHARGWNIDEDDEERPWWWPWRELRLYWQE